MGPVFQKKLFFVQNRKKNKTHHHLILHIQNSLCTKFYSKQSKEPKMLRPNLVKKVIFSLKQKKLTSHPVSHIRINLGNKFYLKQAIWNFWNKFGQ